MPVKPQAVAIPKSTEHLETGKYGPIYPKTPACYGFTLIAKPHPIIATYRGPTIVYRRHGGQLVKIERREN